MSVSDILTFWFPNESYQEFWFDCSKDLEIKEKFYDILIKAENNDYEEYNFDDNQSVLAMVIILDQFSRNIYRYENFRKNDEKCFDLVKKIFEQNRDIQYPFYQRMFLLLPYRHQRKTIYLDFVISKLKEYKIGATENEIKHIMRFELATIRDYVKVVDTVKLYDTYLDYPILNHSQIDILDPDCLEYSHIEPNKNPININIPIFNSVKKFIEQNNYRKICISLSGGVDSMVLTYILYQLKLKNIIDLIVAVNVDYANRSETIYETEYICKWASYFDIPILTRRIEHMQRESNYDRSFYEEETRKIRFGLYKLAIDKYNIDCVCLGHHHDDLIENVMMNILRGRTDLYGMTMKMVKDGITIVRPMYEHPKKDIFDIANKYYITYMKNTTPEWSFRGTLRNKILKEIELFDKNMLSNLLVIAENNFKQTKIINTLIVDPVIKSLKKYKYGFSIEILNLQINSDDIFEIWGRILSNIFHSQGTHMISHKNLKSFCGWIVKNNNKMCQLNNNYIAFKKDKYIYFIHRSIQMMSVNRIPKIINYSEIDKTEIIYNNWKIKLEPTTECIRNNIQIENILNGHFTYTEAINPDNMFYLKYSLEMNDKTRNLFKGLYELNNFFPKISSGNLKFIPNGFVKVSFEIV